MKLETKGFSSVLNTNRKLIFQYNAPPPASGEGVGGGGEANFQFLFPSDFDEIQNLRVSGVLNTNLKLIFPYDPIPPLPY